MAPGERVLSLRELNRTILARQFLLERTNLPVVDVVARLVALQAQLAQPPYVGLWTRLTDFAQDDLAAKIEHKRIVKATLLRGTLHLVTADDYLKFRASLQPVLTSALDAIVKQRGARVDVPMLVDAVREFMLEKPRSFAEITTLLTGLVPDEFIHVLADAHVYRDHVDAARQQLERHPYPSPRLALDPSLRTLDDVVARYRDIVGRARAGEKPGPLLDSIARLEQYQFHPPIEAKMAV